MLIAVMSRGQHWHVNSFLIPPELIIEVTVYKADGRFCNIVCILTRLFPVEGWLAG